ncbi:MAG: hypothetical protein AAGI49_17145, partial [Bacteroidota bacterium]
LLTHKMRIIQVRRLLDDRRSRLEKFLTLFNQAWVSSRNYILDLQEVPEEFEDVAKYLQGPVQDEAFRNKLKAEEELDLIFGKQEAAMAKVEQELEEVKEQIVIEKQKTAEAEQKIEEAAQKAAAAEQREKQMKLQFAQFLLENGRSVDEIVEQTGLTEAEITALQ